MYVSSMSNVLSRLISLSIPLTNKRRTVTSTNCHPDARKTCSPLPTKTRMAGSRSRASKRSFAISGPLIACLALRLRQFSVRRENPTPKSSSVVSWNLFRNFLLPTCPVESISHISHLSPPTFPPPFLFPTDHLMNLI